MSTAPATELIRAIITHMSDGGFEWTSFTVVIGLNPSGSARQSYGYSFDGDGPPRAISTDPYEIREALHDYLASVYQDGDAMPVSIRVQFDRSLGRYQVEFEDTDRDRWKVTPGNIDTIRETFRPQFD